MSETPLAPADSNQDILGIQVTIDGEKLVRKGPDGNPYVVEPEQKILLPISDLFKPAHHEAMVIIHTLVEKIREMKDRKIPPTRQELIVNGVSKKMIRQLEGFALIRNRILPIVAQSGKTQDSRSVVYFTPQGNAYVRDQIVGAIHE